MDLEKEYNESIDDAIRCLERLRLYGATEIAFDDSAATRPEVRPGLKDRLEACFGCRLRQEGVSPAIGEGRQDARLLFVCSAPERHQSSGWRLKEEQTALFTRIINAMGFNRHDVYLACAVKCRVPEQESAEAEVSSCRGYLLEEISKVSPAVVVALGPAAAKALLGDSSIERLRGRFHAAPGLKAGVKVMPTWPLDKLVTSEPLKKETWEDMKMVMRELK